MGTLVIIVVEDNFTTIHGVETKTPENENIRVELSFDEFFSLYRQLSETYDDYIDLDNK